MTNQEIINQYQKEISRIPTIKDNEEAKDYIDTILFSSQRVSKMRARNPATGTFYLDHIQVKVYYTEAVARRTMIIE